jgi:hypothetical protein
MGTKVFKLTIVEYSGNTIKSWNGRKLERLVISISKLHKPNNCVSCNLPFRAIPSWPLSQCRKSFRHWPWPPHSYATSALDIGKHSIQPCLASSKSKNGRTCNEQKNCRVATRVEIFRRHQIKSNQIKVIRRAVFKPSHTTYITMARHLRC